tara:strand:+ start:86 stop:469 length:384 start_codon:yes stop_codon:yes gene_type:complete
MSNILKENIDFINLLAVTILLYNLHSGFAKNNNWELTPINSIYIFNFFAVLFFIISSRLNIAHKLVKPLAFFILLTFIKMLATIIFFIYYKNDSFYDIKIVAYNFFPVYFLFLSFEIFSLKKTFNNI